MRTAQLSPFPHRNISLKKKQKEKEIFTHLTISGRRNPMAAFSDDFKFDRTTVNASRISVDVSTGHEGFFTSVSGFLEEKKISLRILNQNYYQTKESGLVLRGDYAVGVRFKIGLILMMNLPSL